MASRSCVCIYVCMYVCMFVCVYARACLHVRGPATLSLCLSVLFASLHLSPPTPPPFFNQVLSLFLSRSLSPSLPLPLSPSLSLSNAGLVSFSPVMAFFLMGITWSTDESSKLRHHPIFSFALMSAVPATHLSWKHQRLIYCVPKNLFQIHVYALFVFCRICPME